MSDFMKIYEYRKKRERRAFNALEVAMKLVQRRGSIDPIQFLHLKRLRDMASEKRMSSFKQKTLKNFFSTLQRHFNVYC